MGLLLTFVPRCKMFAMDRDYSATLQFLFTQLPMYQRVGAAAYKANLDNTLALDAHYGHPHRYFRSVHVAGTNGKGSTSHMLAAVLQRAGYRVGLYTSPHLRDFRERIRVNGEMISEADVVRFVADGRPLFERLRPSFFEMTVAMAFSYFAQQHVDVAVVEVGLGGRLDSTNIIEPEVAVVTNIALDHMALLGGTVQRIAAEKAGIFKQGVPAVLGQDQPPTNAVFEAAAQQVGAPLIKAWQRYAPIDVDTIPHPDGLQRVSVRCAGGQVKTYSLDLMGQYQRLNLPGVLCAIDALRERGFSIADGHIELGMSAVQVSTGLMGRWQRLGSRPDIFCDIGHNADGIAQVVRQIKAQRYARLHFVLGVAGDKDVEPMLALLPTQARYYFVQAGIPRALDAERLMQLAQRHGLSGELCGPVAEGLARARAQSAPDDLIVVGGSAFVVAEVV